MDDLVAWIEGLFDDCSLRAPFGIAWELDRVEPPLTATVTPADCSTANIVLRRDDVGERISFAEQVRFFLASELDRPVPPCPNHQTGLVPVRVGHEVEWRCRKGDFGCRVGDYHEALWPPASDAYRDTVAPMVAARFRRRGAWGIHSFDAELRDGRWVVTVKLGPDGDETIVRDAAAPVPVEVERVPAMRTVRLERPATETEPAHRALALLGGASPLAALRGRLRRAGANGDCDFLIDATPVRLLPEHRIGSPGDALVLDASGHPVAVEGDHVCCVGGFGKRGPVRGETPVFTAAELRVYP